jgi:hypothetical protein
LRSRTSDLLPKLLRSYFLNFPDFLLISHAGSSGSIFFLRHGVFGFGSVLVGNSPGLIGQYLGVVDELIGPRNSDIKDYGASP